ncbi:hypothetical protein BC937DRAFT_86250 [Endogone sp. FLAS-F59071]|nr:hypothetical protein BC937DRAFT_86250 [Endogone sp. FLAS-F59071]|eukprot:RUS20164.1 hypothetical protein BC937DRAFT_86250 [Endogone sp. FLAS-F59071]
MANSSENATLEILKGENLDAQQAICSHSNDPEAPSPIDHITNPEYPSNHPPTISSLKHTNLALPPEILSEIFAFLAVDSTPETFSMDILACSLVCHGWNYTAIPIVRGCFGISGLHPKTLYEIGRIRAILTDVNFLRLGYLALISKVVAFWEHIVHCENLEAFTDIFQVIGTVWHPQCMLLLRLPTIHVRELDITNMMRFVRSINHDWRPRLTRLSLSVCHINKETLSIDTVISLLATLVNLEEIHLLDRSYLSAAVFRALSKCTRLSTVIIGRPRYIDSRALFFAIRSWPLLREFAIQLERTCIKLAPIVTQLTRSCPALTRLTLEGRWWGNLHLGTDDSGSLRLRRALFSLPAVRRRRAACLSGCGGASDQGVASDGSENADGARRARDVGRAKESADPTLRSGLQGMGEENNGRLSATACIED